MNNRSKAKLVSHYEKLLNRLKNHFGLTDCGSAAPKVTNRKLLFTNWTSLPNVREFHVKVKENNTLFELIGLEKKNAPEITFEPYVNKKLNEYAKKQILRLEKFRKEGNAIKYFQVSWILMRRSSVFRTMAFNHVFHNWHRNKKMWWVLKINKKVNTLIDYKDVFVRIHRVYIPKKNSKYRPLGVPAPEWRLFLHMFNNFLYQFVREDLPPSNHAYQPKKGCLTAWQEIFKSGLTDAKNVYEYDLKNFFPSIKHKYLEWQLEKLGIPKKVIEYISLLNKSVPKIPEDTKGVDESALKGTVSPIEEYAGEFTRKSLTNSYTESQILNTLTKDRYHPYLYDQVYKKGGFKLDISALKDKLSKEDLLAILDVNAQLPSHGPNKNPNLLHRKEETDPVSKFLHDRSESKDLLRNVTHTGVAQGTPTGPLLSLISLKPFLTQLPNLSYADDGLFYSNLDFEAWDLPTAGIKFSESKCGWVKKDGRWLKPLKFLGLEFDGESLKASTRTGSTIVLGKEKAAALLALEKLEREGTGSSGDFTWEDLMKSKYIGYLQSRLYYGKWNIKDLHQQFTYNYGEESWSSLNRFRYQVPLDVFNSSSFASYSLTEILTRTFGGIGGRRQPFSRTGIRLVYTTQKA